jgi:hypothetical protein|tara:strand:- start:43 stop:549 length:507 start_codon:yes stop_codon:yes gene_type:complete
MTKYEPMTDWYLPENIQTGLCLETVLHALVDSQRTCIDNQPKSKTYKEGIPQSVRMEWDGDDRSPELPCDFFTHGLSVPIDLDLAPLAHPLIYKRVTIEKTYNLLTETSYQLPSVVAFKNLLDQLKQGRWEVLGLLEITNVEEYNLRGLQESMGMPRDLYDMAEELAE